MSDEGLDLAYIRGQVEKPAYYHPGSARVIRMPRHVIILDTEWRLLNPSMRHESKGRLDTFMIFSVIGVLTSPASSVTLLSSNRDSTRI